ncbi:DeoR/GlpR family DNA-binding transcription regulator [Clostridium oryzae]|uniref:HTH-type transcriptional repressor GlcR n=1 Tax=Clostridium oryzae TaxID=1450648 RepID=A0A1V4IEM4_9CLOT|nr:DeoR/GlpR family DNA-binding transcription regulator [Clostridium oryzae]OPJ57987.1 HTH-type transcriptional repressor GlcR [Clostridium oryzae]
MLTEERHKVILTALSQKEIASIAELMELTDSSESTIRRDLTFLENENALKRVHGGAALLKKKFIEPSYDEKLIQNIDGKNRIAQYAASLIENGDCIYIDAGTTTYEMIKYIDKKDIIVVTNGLKHIDALVEKDINSFIVGGKVKAQTKAIIGVDALNRIQSLRFDKAFIGINGVHKKYGFTTPDTDEAVLKEAAIKFSVEAFVLADKSKFGEIAFVKVADLNHATIITDEEADEVARYKEKTKIKVV